jgi:hypothetical protein
MSTDEDRLHEERLEQFERLMNLVDRVMKQFGRHDSLSALGDYSVLGDYWGYPQVKVDVHDLRLLDPYIIEWLKNIVAAFPGWEIVVTLAIRRHYDDWPDMGLYVRAHEIFDTLQRQYFPKEFQTLEYEGSRRGTERKHGPSELWLLNKPLAACAYLECAWHCTGPAPRRRA